MISQMNDALEDCSEEGNKRKLKRFFLIELPYFYRNKFIHPMIPLPLFDSMDSVVINSLGIVMETWLDEHLIEYFRND